MRQRILFAAVGMILLIGALAAAFLIIGVHRPTGKGSDEPVLFEVTQGEGFSNIKKRLAEEGLIRYPKALALYAWLRRVDRRIHVGTYSLTSGERPKDILDKLVRGDIYHVSVTVPEGFMYHEIAGALAAAAVDSAAFFALSDDEALRAELKVEGASLEGYLFPDTYLVPWGAEGTSVATMMVGRLEEVFDEEAAARAAEIGMSRHEVLTLASIVQAETRLPAELPLVSAVYHNRLELGMRLEADPTVAYAMGGYRGRLYYKDLEIDSPYNTYRTAGLPPGPICSAGEAAIHAALYPDATCRAIYFVAQGDGGHVFSLTLQDHLAAVRNVRRQRSSR